MTTNAPSTPGTKMKSKIDYPIKQHLQDSWDRFTNGLLPAFLVSLVAIVVGVVVFGAIGLMSGGLVLGNETVLSAFQNLETMGPAALMTIPGSFWASISGLVLVYVVIATVMSLVGQAAILLAFANAEEKPAVGTLIKKGFSVIVPMFLVGLLVSFLALGGTWLFFLPGIIISLMLSFSLYAVVIDGKGPVQAMKYSVQLISGDFGFFFVRLLVITGLYLLLFMVLPAILGEISETLAGVYSLLSMFVAFGWSWFTMSYMLELYNKIKDNSTNNKPGSLTWMVIVAILGWLLFAVGFKLLVGFAQSEVAKELANDLPSYIEEELTAEEQAEFEAFMDQVESGELELDEDFLEQMEELEAQMNKLEATYP